MYSGRKQTKLLLPDDGEGVLEIPVSTVKDGVHELLLFKRQDSCHEITFWDLKLKITVKFWNLHKSRIEG